MGRGRAKAKQAKVARELKYNSGGMTDLERLRQELIGGPSTTVDRPSEPEAADVDAADIDEAEVDEDEDDYADPYADRYEDGDEAGGRSA